MKLADTDLTKTITLHTFAWHPAPTRVAHSLDYTGRALPSILRYVALASILVEGGLELGAWAAWAVAADWP